MGAAKVLFCLLCLALVVALLSGLVDSPRGIKPCQVGAFISEGIRRLEIPSGPIDPSHPQLKIQKPVESLQSGHARLIVEDLEIPAVLHPDQPFEVLITIANRGTETSGGFQVRLVAVRSAGGIDSLLCAGRDPNPLVITNVPPGGKVQHRLGYNFGSMPRGSVWTVAAYMLGVRGPGANPRDQFDSPCTPRGPFDPGCLTRSVRFE